jgi:hypothetical protein
MRYLREVGELRRIKLTPFKGLTWKKGTGLTFVSGPAKLSETNRERRSLLVIRSPDKPKSFPLRSWSWIAQSAFLHHVVWTVRQISQFELRIARSWP